MPILEINEVSKSYGNLLALDRVSLTIEEGEIYGLLGPNGAGKSTLIRMIAGLTKPDSGTLRVNGPIAYLPEERGLYKKMRVGDQALFLARLKGMRRDEAEAELHQWFGRFGIESWWDKPVEELSKGMAQKVQFICTVLTRPKLVILDEPMSGFDPVNAQAVKDEIIRLKKEGMSFILSTHDMASVEELCDRITLLNHGRTVLEGRTADIRQQYSTGEVRMVPVIPSMNEIFIKVVQ